MNFAFLKVLKEYFDVETKSPTNMTFGVEDSVMTVKVAEDTATITTCLDMQVLGPTSTVPDLGDFKFDVN